MHANQAKARKAIQVPLNAEAVLVVKQQAGKHPDWVFIYKGRPITRANKPCLAQSTRPGWEGRSFNRLFLV